MFQSSYWFTIFCSHRLYFKIMASNLRFLVFTRICVLSVSFFSFWGLVCQISFRVQKNSDFIFSSFSEKAFWDFLKLFLLFLQWEKSTFKFQKTGILTNFSLKIFSSRIFNQHNKKKTIMKIDVKIYNMGS